MSRRLWLGKLILSCAICFGLVPSISAQEADKDSTLKIETTLVSVPVIVSDRQGRYVSDLKAADFTLYEDRIKQRIDFFAATEEPVNVALLLDTSKSTADVLGEIKDAAKNFIKNLRPQDRATILSFDWQVRQLSALTGDRRVLERAIESAQIGERFGTVLYDAVNQVRAKQFKNLKGRKAIILLTDGKDHGSYVSENDLLDSAAEADTLIYSIFYLTGPQRMFANDRRLRFPGGWDGPRRNRRVEMRNEQAIEFLQELSDVSAGRYYHSEVADLKRTFELIVEELRHQYRLGFYPADGHQPDSVHNLRVEVSRRDMVVRSRRSYRVGPSS